MELILKILLFVLIIVMAICVLLIIWNLNAINKLNQEIIDEQDKMLKIRKKQVECYERALKSSEDLVDIQKAYIKYLKSSKEVKQ